MRGLALSVMLVSLGCGASAELVAAHQATYTAHRDQLWPEIVKVVQARYPKLEIEQLDGTTLVTRWVATGRRVVESEDETTSGTGSMGRRGESTPEVMRVVVEITGANPFHVNARVEAAMYMSSERPPVSFQHGAADEPVWVPGATDDLTVRIYDGLKGLGHGP